MQWFVPLTLIKIYNISNFSSLKSYFKTLIIVFIVCFNKNLYYNLWFKLIKVPSFVKYSKGQTIIVKYNLSCKVLYVNIEQLKKLLMVNCSKKNINLVANGIYKFIKNYLKYFLRLVKESKLLLYSYTWIMVL